MALFLSTVVNKVDRKGRVSVPAAMRAALASLRFDVIKVEAATNDDPGDAKVYLSKRLGPFVLDAHRAAKQVKS